VRIFIGEVDPSPEVLVQQSVPAIQLAHAGRKASHSSPWKGNKALTKDETAWETFAPSAIPYRNGEPAPTEMNNVDIEKVIGDFREAARRSIEAGFEIIEIHAAHGYLINAFLSPLSNQRTDEYGGSFDNRIRLLKKIITAVRNIIPESMPLLVRISATDWVDGGWNATDSVALANIIKDMGVDMIDCSTGGNSSEQKIPVAPIYQVSFSEQIKKETGILTAAVGLITTSEEAEAILKNDQSDLIVMARQFLRDPYFPLHAAKEIDVDIEWPVQYQRAKR
ncbi:MAG: oxidoreductase, partial [Ferruginibacter sp.]